MLTALPAGLLDTFWDYERALVSNDVAVLERAFLDSPETLRAEGSAVLVGSTHIGAYRRVRRPPPDRRIDRLHVRVLADGLVLLVAEAVRADSGTGTQTQLWRHTNDGWRITAAHVAIGAPVQPVQSGELDDTAIWRTASRPLRAGSTGPLAGLRLAVKDLFAVAGGRIGAGNPTWLATAATQTADAPALATLLAAGAELTGVAQTDELAFSLAGVNVHYGTPSNPAVPGAIPGGSSSGPAVAVAAGLADLGLGTDTAGSIRVPTSYCGLYGLRPTHGAIALDGVVGLAPSFDTAGLLSASAGTLRTAADVLLPTPTTTPLHTLVVARDLLEPLDVDVQVAFEAAVQALSGRAALRIEVRDGLGDRDAWLAAFRTVQTAEAWRTHGAFVTAHPDALAGPVAARFRIGATVTAAEEEAARTVLADAGRALDLAVPPGTALALPAAAGVAPPVDLDADAMDAVRAATLRLTCLASLSGRPALVLPTMRVGPAPVGLCLVGARGEDRALLTTLELGVSRDS